MFVKTVTESQLKKNGTYLELSCWLILFSYTAGRINSIGKKESCEDFSGNNQITWMPMQRVIPILVSGRACIQFRVIHTHAHTPTHKCIYIFIYYIYLFITLYILHHFLLLNWVSLCWSFKLNFVTSSFFFHRFPLIVASSTNFAMFRSNIAFIIHFWCENNLFYIL